ncbi:MAG: sel1 repeat family protein [Telluria sp.]
MKRFLFCLLLTIAGTASADVLSEANRLLKDGAYGEAFPVFQMLANSGNAEAKLRLGQMYWYGKGLPADRAQADKLFAEAAKAGNKEAASAMTLTQRREAHAAEIAKWTAYNGADLAAGKYACTEPAIGEVGKTNAEIKATTEAYQAWSACYNGLVNDLQGPLAPANRIPADVAALMTDAERNQAMEHIVAATDAKTAQVGAGAQALMSRYDSWEQATTAYAKEHNDKIAADSAAQKEKILLEMRKYQSQPGMTIPSTPAPSKK